MCQALKKKVNVTKGGRWKGVDGSKIVYKEVGMEEADKRFLKIG